MNIPQPQYDYILSVMPIVCIDVAIEYCGKVLLIKRADEPARGEWWLPGGRLHKGELLRDCARRKAFEEVGLKCKVLKMIHWESTDFGSVHSVNFCYSLRAVNDDVKLDGHSLDYKWINPISPDGLHIYVKRCLLGL